MLGPATRNHQDWFDENDVKIKTLLEEKRQLHRAHQSDPNSVSKKDAYVSKRREVQIKLRAMQDTWLSNKVDEIQGHADRHDMKHFYDSLKCVFGLLTSGSSPLLTVQRCNWQTVQLSSLTKTRSQRDGQNISMAF